MDINTRAGIYRMLDLYTTFSLASLLPLVSLVLYRFFTANARSHSLQARDARTPLIIN